MPTYVDSTATGSLVLNGQALGSDHCCGGAIDVRIKLEAVLSPFKAMSAKLSDKDKLALGAMIRDARRRGTPKPQRGVVDVLPVERRAYRGGLCVATLAAGPTGRDWLAATGGVMLDYAKKVNAEFRVLGSAEDDSDPFPLRLKWRLAELLDEFDRVLFLDADVVLAPDCPDLFQVVPADRVGLRDDLPHLVKKGWVEPEVEAIRVAAGLPDRGPIGMCLNTGVIVASRCHRDLFLPPAVPVPVLHCTEQHWTNLMLREQGVEHFELPWWAHWHPHIDPARERVEGVKVWHLAGERLRGERLRAKVRELYGREPVPLPVCVHQGAELGGVARQAKGLDHRRKWVACERVGHRRFSLPVTDCRGCGSGASQCGPGKCDGYAAA